MRVLFEEVVLHGPDAVEAQLVAEHDLLDRFLSATRKLSLARPWLIIICFAGLLAANAGREAELVREQSAKLAGPPPPVAPHSCTPSSW